MIILFSFVINADIEKDQEIIIREYITSGNVNPNIAYNLLQRIIIMDAEKRAREKAKEEEKAKQTEKKAQEEAKDEEKDG